MKRILVAGIGNIFLGDDAFGVEVAQRLIQRAPPEGVRVSDFGIRSYDLAYALTETYETVILIDATPRGEAPGTVYLIEPDLGHLEQAGPELAIGHGMNPVLALRMAQSLGGIGCGRLYLVGCEPAMLETDRIGLSEPVLAAVPRAVEKVESLLRELLSASTPQLASL